MGLRRRHPMAEVVAAVAAAGQHRGWRGSPWRDSITSIDRRSGDARPWQLNRGRVGVTVEYE